MSSLQYAEVLLLDRGNLLQSEICFSTDFIYRTLSQRGGNASMTACKSTLLFSQGFCTDVMK